MLVSEQDIRCYIALVLFLQSNKSKCVECIVSSMSYSVNDPVSLFLMNIQIVVAGTIFDYS